MAVQDAKNNNIFTTNPSSETGWKMIEGAGYVKIEVDDKGKYFRLNGGSVKIYLAEYYAQRQNQVKKDMVQQDITNFFAGQIQDFDNRKQYYASKVSELQGGIAQQRLIIEEQKTIAQTNLKKLNPLYQKYETEDPNKFSDNTDKRHGTTWTGLRNKANHSVTISEGLISVKQMFIASYTRLMNHTAMCGNQVKKIAQDCLGYVS